MFSLLWWLLILGFGMLALAVVMCGGLLFGLVTGLVRAVVSVGDRFGDDGESAPMNALGGVLRSLSRGALEREVVPEAEVRDVLRSGRRARVAAALRGGRDVLRDYRQGGGLALSALCWAAVAACACGRRRFR